MGATGLARKGQELLLMAEHLLLQVEDSPEEGVRGGAQRVYDFVLSDTQSELRASTAVFQTEWSELESASLTLSESLNVGLGTPREPLERMDHLVECLERICPDLIHDRLRQESLFLRLQADGFPLPWELVSSIAFQAFVCRVSGQPVRILEKLETQTRPRALLGYNPDGLGDWAEAEIAGARKALGHTFEVEVRQGDEFTTGSLIGALSQGTCAVVHLVVYLTEEGLVLSNGLCRLEELRRLPGSKRPGLVVVHAVMAPGTPVLARSQELAFALLRGGVPAVLVTGWNPGVEAASQLASFLYSEETAGEPLWQSLAAARAKCRNRLDPHLSHLAYFAFGDWETSLAQLSPVRIETAQSAPTAGGNWTPDYQLVVLEGPEAGSSIPLFSAVMDAGRSVTLGRAGPIDVDLAFEDNSLENLTASLSRPEGQLTLSNETGVPEKVRVNGLPLYTPVALEGWEEVQFGETCLRIEPASGGAALESTAGPLARVPILEVLEGVDEDKALVLELPSRVTLIGRLPDCGLMLHDPEVSRHHLTLVPKRSAFFVSSVGNATLVVNGFVSNGEHQLKNGDTLQLSPTTILKFSLSKGPS